MATVIALLSLLLVLLGFREYRISWRLLVQECEGNSGDQVEEENTHLVQRHASVVQSVKLLDRQMKPSAMPSMYPIVCEQEAQPPHEQDAVVDKGTPEQYLAYYRYTHNRFPNLSLS
jgi:hypothetical protein